MSLLHVTYFNPLNGRWHAGYNVPGSLCISSIGDAPTEHGASQIANEANAVQVQQERAAIQAAIYPADRHIPAGFYSDSDAA